MKILKGLLLLVLVGVVFSANSQTKFGIGGGMNFSNFTGKNVENTERLKRLNGGIIAEYKFPAKFGIEIDFLLSQKGGKSKLGSLIFLNELTYFDIPLVFKIYNLKILSLQLGVQQSLLNGPEGAGNRFKTSDFSLVFGFGVDVKRFHFSTRYTYSVSTISEYQDAEVLNSVVTLTAGIWLKK